MRRLLGRAGRRRFLLSSLSPLGQHLPNIGGKRRLRAARNPLRPISASGSWDCPLSEWRSKLIAS
ncbi:hypothetical protein [Hymenobacter actinosclerus]|uniref:hypothetical protein n=1 Tax=Hymenobacter actinosclerus TaxID=82805 RepID=UPI0015A4F534|nr:hypothetical protein [Hymenobacter actinosclerus]